MTKRGLVMLMWADRLIDGDRWNMGEWEASKVGTAPAVDKIPKDIILCPWHYEPRAAYESLPMFMEKGFRVLPASWKNVEASNALIRYGQEHQRDGRLVGHIFTTWSASTRRPGDLAAACCRNATAPASETMIRYVDSASELSVQSARERL